MCNISYAHLWSPSDRSTCRLVPVTVSKGQPPLFSRILGRIASNVPSTFYRFYFIFSNVISSSRGLLDIGAVSSNWKLSYVTHILKGASSEVANYRHIFDVFFRWVTRAYHNIVKQATSGGSTVNLCTIDLSKAFDKVNHNALFIKLMKRKIPTVLLELLENLFRECYSCVYTRITLTK